MAISTRYPKREWMGELLRDVVIFLILRIDLKCFSRLVFFYGVLRFSHRNFDRRQNENFEGSVISYRTSFIFDCLSGRRK